MKRLLLNICLLGTAVLMLSSCATIFGGTHYMAKVTVPNHPDASITVNGSYMGNGEVNISVKRRDADKLSILVEKEGCEPQLFPFMSKEFRGWAFAGSLVLWSGITSGGIIIPFGVAVDGISGAWWKPDVDENYVSQQGYDHFTYTLPYLAAPTEQTIIDDPQAVKPEPVDKVKLLRELKALLDEGILTQEEFEKEKAKILNSDDDQKSQQE